MSLELKECQAQASKLSPAERALLAEHLIASLDFLDDAENERLWADEAERRYQQYKIGNISAHTAEEVFRDARNSIR